MATERQKRVAKAITENIRNKKYNNKGKLLEDSGYSKQTTLKPKVVIDSKGVQEELSPLIKRLIIERDRAVKHMKLKIKDAKYRDCTDATDKLTKNIELLQGNATERVQSIDITEEQRARILAEENNRA